MKVTGVERVADVWEVVTTTGPLKAKLIINCGGNHADTVELLRPQVCIPCRYSIVHIYSVKLLRYQVGIPLWRLGMRERIATKSSNWSLEEILESNNIV